MSAGQNEPPRLESLPIIAGAMGLGIVMMTAVIVYLYFQITREVTPAALAASKMLTAIAAAVAVVTIVASELLWKSLSKGGADGALINGFIARTACREGGALLGCMAALISAQNGVLRAYPAYWADLVPALLFWVYLYAHWPTPENLRSEASQVL